MVLTMNNDIVTTWEQIKSITVELELLILKNASGNASAGVKARKGLRDIKKKVADLVKLMVEAEKVNKQAKSTPQEPTSEG